MEINSLCRDNHSVGQLTGGVNYENKCCEVPVLKMLSTSRVEISITPVVLKYRHHRCITNTPWVVAKLNINFFLMQ